MLGNLGLEVVHVAVALIVVINDYDLHAGHGGGGGVGSVGRLGDEANVPVALPLGLEVSLDAEEAGELAGGAGVGLSGDCSEAGDLDWQLR